MGRLLLLRVICCFSSFLPKGLFATEPAYSNRVMWETTASAPVFYESDRIAKEEKGAATTPGTVWYMSLEVMGKAGYASLSAERKWTVLTHFFVQPGVGIGTALLYDFEGALNPDLTFPAHLFLGMQGKHRPELGITYTGSYYTVATLGSTQKGRQYRSFLFGHIGYRLESRLGFLRLAYTPRLMPSEAWVHMGGITLGYGF